MAPSMLSTNLWCGVRPVALMRTLTAPDTVAPLAGDVNAAVRPGGGWLPLRTLTVTLADPDLIEFLTVTRSVCVPSGVRVVSHGRLMLVLAEDSVQTIVGPPES